MKTTTQMLDEQLLEECLLHLVPLWKGPSLQVSVPVGLVSAIGGQLQEVVRVFRNLKTDQVRVVLHLEVVHQLACALLLSPRPQWVLLQGRCISGHVQLEELRPFRRVGRMSLSPRKWPSEDALGQPL